MANTFFLKTAEEVGGSANVSCTMQVYYYPCKNLTTSFSGLISLQIPRPSSCKLGLHFLSPLKKPLIQPDFTCGLELSVNTFTPVSGTFLRDAKASIPFIL